MEGQNKKKYGQLVSLSEQQLIDCTRADGENGCDGGLQDHAFNYIRNNAASSSNSEIRKMGLDTESNYPYTAQVGPKQNGTCKMCVQDGDCRYPSTSTGGGDGGFADIATGDEDALKEAVANIGPISVGINVVQGKFDTYKTGVYTQSDCPPQPNHAVLVVGYGTDAEGTWSQRKTQTHSRL